MKELLNVCGPLVNIFVGRSVSARRITYEYSIDDVTATWIELGELPCIYILDVMEPDGGVRRAHT